MSINPGWFNPEQQQVVWNQILPLLANGRIKPTVANVFDAAQTPSAQRSLMEDRPFGKVLIRF